MLAHRAILSAQLTICKEAIQDLLKQASTIETDTQLSNENKLSQLKKIKEEMNKIAQDIDNIKKEIMFMDAHKVN